jgi:serine/threonine protein kinase
MSSTEAILAERALALYNKTFQDATVQDASEEFPKFAFSELDLGKRLGEGGFGVVSEVLAFHVAPHEKEAQSLGTAVQVPAQVACHHEESGVEVKAEEDDPDFQGRKFIADHCIRNGCDARYAIKILKKSLVEKGDNNNLLVKALADMAVETHILSVIEHTNIVKIRGTSQQERFHPEYFIVMDRLYDTLEKRLEQWAERFPKPPPVAPPQQQKKPPTKPNSKTFLGWLCGGSSKETSSNDQEEEKEDLVEMTNPVSASFNKDSPEYVEKKKLLEERLVASFDLASAIAYLHARNIIYRDIKPENCGKSVNASRQIMQ